MCSIVSKNNFEEVKNVLESWEVFDLFIFPQINWNPKGNQIKDILQLCALRAENTLFIDDNLSNLNEAKYYNHGIMTATPDILNGNFLGSVVK